MVQDPARAQSADGASAPSPPHPRLLRLVRVVATLVVLVCPLGGAYVLLLPDGWSINRLNVFVWGYAMAWLGDIAPMTPEQFADVMNVVLFIPFFCALTILVPTWWWILAGALLSGAVETYQLLLGGGRTPQLTDIATNTLGAALGVALGMAIVRLLAGRRRRYPGARA